jgi:hypothetical protein
VRLAQRGVDERLAGVPAAAGERDLPGVSSQVVAPAGEDGVQGPALVLEHRHEHGRLLAAVDVHGGRLGGLEEPAGEVLRGAQARSTRSSNATSPSSVR